ncbi:hypothetical protein CHLRE_10g439550v5 [Chlamydomonas reinhardtii]|uniref:Oxidation resistance protein 1 n=1 Tax=Chlamydomonas reinhardtii TaxID=3055 RepID=A0A2K3DAE3_CHLRE|nr:uncharacterized protein CHLRE_10g439550v5 [Chlamydomonas reinhardtii]PNW77505.1 hypothetical protein CHLRE_10g439550v5 [Chlamydomonas reinhardtii]
MDSLDAAQLRAVLDDAQASLAAALGRIEAFRIREKQVMNELSQLRAQVHGGASAGPPTPSARQAPLSAQPAGAGQSKHAEEKQSTQQEAAPPKGAQPAWTSPGAQPVYVTNIGGDYPIHIISGSKKVPGSLVVTPEYVDFVEVKARVRLEEFVGISTVKTDTPKDFDEDAAAGDQAMGVWQILWSKGGVPQRQAFEASVATREALHRCTQRWLGQVDDGGTKQKNVAVEGTELEIAVPRNLMVGDATLTLVGDASAILTEGHARALASAIPPLERMKEWTLSYSTTKHGTSLQTLYRKAVPGMATILLIRDFGGYTFGCYTPDSWRVSPRYYGSGETFVFQLEPYRVAYPWRSMSKEKNDYFQYGTPECLAVGGLGHFAIWVDADLMQGSSGTCGTFGSPCLAHSEDFKVHVVEMWQATQG